jgi:transposase
MEKIDARKLTPDGRNQLRQLVVRLRQQSGLPAEDLAKVAGAHVSTVKGWLARAKREGAGSLAEKPRGRPAGACRRITLAQEVWLREQIIGATPQQLTLPFALWTRRAIRELVLARFGVDVQDRLVGKYLKRWGFTPQRPVKRALEQRPALVAKWLDETYPALAAKARRENAAIYFGDETAVKEDANWVRGYAPKGRTPVLAVPARWVALSMISAISPRGEVAFRIVDGAVNAERFVEFLAALIDGAPRKIILVVDNLRVHHAKSVAGWLAGKADQIELAFLPPYNPEANPDEYLNHDFKTALRLGPVSADRESLLEKAMAFMARLATWPERVRAYFQHPKARYALSAI